jgi:hypothetical protein
MGHATAPAPIDGAPTRERRWIPVCIVVALIALVVGGAQAFAAVVTVRAGGSLLVGAAVQIQPRPGWDVQTVSASPPSARLHRGPVVLDVWAMDPEPTGPVVVGERYVDEHLRTHLSQLAVATPAPTSLANGVPAVSFAYSGFSTDGRTVGGVVVAATGAAASVVFDASAPSGELVTVADDLRTMVDGAVIG